MSQNEENSRHARNQNKYRRMNPQDYQNNETTGQRRASTSEQNNNQYEQNQYGANSSSQETYQAQQSEQAQKSSAGGGFNPRRQKKSSRFSEHSSHRDHNTKSQSNGGGRNYEDNYSDTARPTNGGSQQPPKQKRPKKHRILKTLLIILLLLVGVIGVQYFRGVQAAKKDIGAATVTETFNGSKAADGSTNILLIGSDLRPSSTTTSRADTIMIVHLEKGQKKPKLVSIMRDTYVAIPGHGSNKINAAYAYGGAELLRQTIEQNFGITLRYYVRVDFQSFEDVVDQMYPNGVEINAEKDIAEMAIKAGDQKMSGAVLLKYARFRHDEEGDFGRVRRQQQVIDALIQQAKSPLTLFNLPKATGAAMTYTSTDLPLTFTVAQAASYLFKGASGIDRLSVPVANSWSYGSYADAGSVIEINFDTNKAAINSFFAG